jgi:hypothetical protein
VIDDDGLSTLIGAVLRYTAQDYAQGQYWDKKSAEHFIETEWFSHICESVKLEPNKVKVLICTCPVRRRIYYE